MAHDSVSSDSSSEDGILALTRGLARGEEESWAQFYDQYHRRLRGYLAACWRGEPECLDDLLQETFVRAVRHMKPFHDEATFWSWLIVLGRSAVADRGRKETRMRRFLSSFRIERPVRMPSDEELQSALAKLSPEERALLKWKYEDSLSVAEISAELKISGKAVESRLTRARQSLRRYYRP